jgi:hypothetical protein
MRIRNLVGLALTALTLVACVSRDQAAIDRGKKLALYVASATKSPPRVGPSLSSLNCQTRLCLGSAYGGNATWQ